MLQGLGDKSGAVQEKKRELEGLQAQLRGSVGESMRRGWETWVKEDEARENRWRAGVVNGEECGDIPALTSIPQGGDEIAQAEEERLRWEVEEKRKARAELVKQYVTAQAEVSLVTSLGLWLVTNEVDWYRRKCRAI